MRKITDLTLTLLAIASIVTSFSCHSHQQDSKASPYLVASLDLRSMEDHEAFSLLLLKSNEQPVYLSLITDFDAPCSGWIDGPNYDEEAVTCDWLITLDKCDPYEKFGGEISLTDENECRPLLYIQSPIGDAYNRVRRCRGYGYHFTGFYSVQYLEATHGREVYEAMRVPVDPERARVTHQQILEQTCYSMPTKR